MKKQTFLFSACNALLWLLSYNNVYADVLNFKTTDKIFFTNTQHTQFLSDTSDLSPDKFVKVAQVCWIMDTGDCKGLDFFGSDINTPLGDDPIDYKPQDFTNCIDEGYTLTSCPEGYEPNKFCLYDSRYFAECVPTCPDNYKKCEDPYYGVGEECNGMYPDCQCDECEGYDYKEEDIPAGYVADGEPCNSCNGPRYKIKPNPCDGFLDCGDMGCESGAQTCQSGENFLCSNCKPCPNKCDLPSCPANASCDYEDCSNKYCFKNCNEGYDWDAATKNCVKSCIDGCTYTSCPSGFTCEQDPCTGKYCKIGCTSSSKWFSEETKECCSRYYIYDENNCSSTENYHCKTSCGGKYDDCLQIPQPTYTSQGIKYYDKCDIEYVDANSGASCSLGFFGQNTFRYGIDNGNFVQCAYGDNNCSQLRQVIAEQNASVTTDMYCGNIGLGKYENITLKGNNHTITFEPSLSQNEQKMLNGITLENLNIVGRILQKDGTSCNGLEYSYDTCNANNADIYIGYDITLRNSTVNISQDKFFLKANIDQNVSVDMGTIYNTQKTYLKINKDAVYNQRGGYLSSAEILGPATINLDRAGIQDIKPQEDGVIINWCSDNSSEDAEYAMYHDCYKMIYNSNVPIEFRTSGSKKCQDYITVNLVPDICEKMNF